MISKVNGTTTVRRAFARSKNSYCPDQATETPGESFTFSATKRRASFTTATRSRPRMST
jgi:hypothetical protein